MLSEGNSNNCKECASVLFGASDVRTHMKMLSEGKSNNCKECTDVLF